MGKIIMKDNADVYGKLVPKIPLMAIGADVFTAMQTQCMESLRNEFDSARHFTHQDDVIERAKAMQMPGEFIKELRNDLDTEKAHRISLTNGIIDEIKKITDEYRIANNL